MTAQKTEDTSSHQSMRKRNQLEHDENNEWKQIVAERKTKRGRGGTNSSRAAVAQRGCQLQSGVGWQDSQGAVTGGESWETCVSCLPRRQTTSLCFTGPFPPSTHRRHPPTRSLTIHHPEKKNKKKQNMQQGYLHTCSEGLQTGKEMEGETQRRMKERWERR